MKKLLALFLVLVMLFSFAACGEDIKVKTEADFKTWFNEALVPAYDGYINSESASEDAFPSISLMLASDAYIGYIFDYICDGVYPENGEITEDEVLDAKKSYANRMREISDNPSMLPMWYFMRQEAGGLRDPERDARDIMEIDVEKAVEFAKTISLDTVYILAGGEKE